MAPLEICYIMWSSIPDGTGNGLLTDLFNDHGEIDQSNRECLCCEYCDALKQTLHG